MATKGASPGFSGSQCWLDAEAYLMRLIRLEVSQRLPPMA